MVAPDLENVTRPMRAGPVSPPAFDSMYIDRVVGRLPRAEMTSEQHRSEGQASDKPQRTKPRARLISAPQAENAYGDSAGVHVPVIAAQPVRRLT